MAESLFDETGEGEFKLKGTVEEIKAKGWKWIDVFEFVGDNIVWTTKDCSVVRRDPPEDHAYTLDFIYTLGENQKKKKFEITAPTMDDAVSTVNGMLSLIDAPDQSKDEVILKCFAKTPRSPLVPLSPLESQLPCLRLHFVSLDSKTCEALLGQSSIGHLELRQCTTEGFSKALLEKPEAGPNELSISCSMPEFAKLASSFTGNTKIKTLTLQLHFFLQGESVSEFCTSLQENAGLEELSIQYLDITDDGWRALCESLHNHPSIKRVKLAFTDNFVDDFRRLTAERRTARSSDVLKLVQASKSIVEFTWPEFQKDENLQALIMDAIEKTKDNSTL